MSYAIRQGAAGFGEAGPETCAGGTWLPFLNTCVCPEGTAWDLATGCKPLPRGGGPQPHLPTVEEIAAAAQAAAAAAQAQAAELGQKGQVQIQAQLLAQLQQACATAGGVWNAAANTCEFAGAAPSPSKPQLPGPVLPAPEPVYEPTPGFWAGLSTGEKVAVVGAGVAVAGLLAFLVWPKKKYTSNRRRGRRPTRSSSQYGRWDPDEICDRCGDPIRWHASQCSKLPRSRHRFKKSRTGYTSNARPRTRVTSRRRVRRRRRRRVVGHVITYRGRRLGHTGIRKKYARLGARRASQYAWPKGLMYPIHDKKHVRAAAARFAKWHRRYPPMMRKTIARRIDAAKRRFGIGEYR